MSMGSGGFERIRVGSSWVVLGCPGLCQLSFGSVRLCSALFGSVRLRSALFGSVRLCSGRFGSVLGSPRLPWALLGSLGLHCWAVLDHFGLPFSTVLRPFWFHFGALAGFILVPFFLIFGGPLCSHFAPFWGPFLGPFWLILAPLWVSARVLFLLPLIFDFSGHFWDPF